MKDILVEFTEYGAIIHKDPAKIEEKKDSPNCFVNPDLSKVYGVSPTFWSLNEYSKIIKCSEEEMQRRNTYHRTVVTTENPKVEKVNIEDLRQEFDEKFGQSEEKVRDELNRLKQELAQSGSSTQEKIDSLIAEINKNKTMLNVSKLALTYEIEKTKKSHKSLIIVLLGVVLFSVIAKIYLDLN